MKFGGRIQMIAAVNRVIGNRRDIDIGSETLLKTG